ncbi:MAG: radical SAM protein [Paludibacter sp.]|nr:radical SAM protein [Paludibacter sp.]
MITNDIYGRTFKKLRVSLTHECNYACLYCADGSKNNSPVSKNYVRKQTILPVSELLQLIENLNNELALETIRLTGGEPMLHPELLTIVAGIKKLNVGKIAMTTNGHMLYSKVEQLRDAGLTSINISLDALDVETFKKMSRNPGLENVLRSIDAAIDCGLEVKLNTVVLNGVNNHQIVPLLDFAMSKNILIRFLELMPMGPLHHSYKELFFSEKQMLNTISEQYEIHALPKENHATAHYWSILGQQTFGIIANDSTPFCKDCDRLRLDSYGNIYGCLSSLKAIELKANTKAYLLTEALAEALTHKQMQSFAGNTRTMQSIGG